MNRTVGLLALAFLLQPNVVCAQNETGLLFAADFVQSLDAKHAVGNPTPFAGTAQPAKEGGIFGNDADPATYRTLTFATESNVNLDRGTMEMWVCPKPGEASTTEHSGVSYLFDLPTTKQDEAGNWRRAVIAVVGTGEQRMINVYFGGQGSEPFSVPITWTAEEWYHLALTWDETLVRLYLNGKEVAAGPTEGGLFDGNVEDKGAIGQFFGIAGLTDAAIGNAANCQITGLKIFDHPVYDGDFEPKKP